VTVSREFKRKETRAGKMRLSRANPRLAEIADAALRMLAREGARGLAHRRVDRELGFPEGSTSAYFRTRDDLIAAAASRLCELDFKDMLSRARRGGAGTREAAIDNFAGQTADTFSEWLSEKTRDRTVARCELFLESTRDARVRKIMARTQRVFQQQTKAFFRGIGTKDPTRAAAIFVDFALGLLYGRTTSLSQPVAKQQLKKLILSTIRTLATD